MENHPPSPKRGVTSRDTLGKTVEETGDKLMTTKSKYNNNKPNIVTVYKKWKK